MNFWLRRYVAASMAIGVLSIFFILQYTLYPYPPYGLWIADFHLRVQDVPGAALLLALLLAAWLVPAPAAQAACTLAEAMGRRPWTTAGFTFAALCLGALYVEHSYPLAQDEYAALFQSEVFAAGRLTGQFPPELLARLIPPFYLNQFLYGSFQSGAVASAYWPGFALLLAPFSLVHAPWACNPLLASLALVLAGRIAARLTGQPQAAGWAMLLALASPAFTAMAITYFSMTAHLLFNLLFVWLLLEKTTLRLVAAGAVGSFALVLHNPLPHTLFALPWIAWLALQPQRYRNLLALAAGYVPLAALIGLGWGFLLAELQGKTSFGLFAADGSVPERIANFFWGWHLRMRTALGVPFDVLEMRLAEAVRLWHWAVPGLPLLAAAGWWLGRHDRRVRLLGLSLLCTAAGYLFIGYSQGHGWGARYLHPAWGVLPVLGAAGLVWARGAPGEALRRYVASLALLSLVLATALRAAQIHDYVAGHLANRPPTSAQGRQIVLIKVDAEKYTQDLVQNDPFLRDEVWMMMSYGRTFDRELMRLRFPDARLVHEDGRGQVWRLYNRLEDRDR
jgi:hypothetical protein